MADEPAKPLTEAPNVRDHLANERTFLAWVRTAIALLGFGVLIAKLRFLEIAPHAGVHSTRLGLAFAGVGVLTLLLAAWHYDRTRRLIDGGDYQAAAHFIFVFAAVVFGLGMASIIYLLTILR
jgi:putative membrane protein